MMTLDIGALDSSFAPHFAGEPAKRTSKTLFVIRIGQRFRDSNIHTERLPERDANVWIGPLMWA
jgi:hypothetical protein